jgi:hypothetical protein
LFGAQFFLVSTAIKMVDQDGIVDASVRFDLALVDGKYSNPGFHHSVLF